MLEADWINDVKFLNTSQQAQAAVSYLPLRVNLIEECAKSEDAQIRCLSVVVLGKTQDVQRARLMALHDPCNRIQGLALMQLAQLADDATLKSVALAISRLRRRKLFHRLRALRRQSTIDSILISLKTVGDMASFHQHLYFGSASFVDDMSLDEFLWTTSKVVKKLQHQQPMALSRLIRRYLKIHPAIEHHGWEVLKELCRFGKEGLDEAFRLIEDLFQLNHSIPSTAFWYLRHDLPRLVDFITSEAVQEHCLEQSKLSRSLEQLYRSTWLYLRLNDRGLQQLMTCSKLPLTWAHVLQGCPVKCEQWRREAAEKEFDKTLREIKSKPEDARSVAHRIANFPKDMRERLALAALRHFEMSAPSDLLAMAAWDVAYPELCRRALKEDSNSFWCPCYMRGNEELGALMKLTNFNRDHLTDMLSLIKSGCFTDDKSEIRWDRLDWTYQHLTHQPVERLKVPTVHSSLRELIDLTLRTLARVTETTPDWQHVAGCYQHLTILIRRFITHDVHWTVDRLKELASLKLSTCSKQLFDEETGFCWSPLTLAWPFADDLPEHLTHQDFTADIQSVLLDFLYWRLEKIEKIVQIKGLLKLKGSRWGSEPDANLNISRRCLWHKRTTFHPYMEELLQRTALHPILSEAIAQTGWNHCRDLYKQKLGNVMDNSPSFVEALTTRISLARTEPVRLLRHLESLEDLKWPSYSRVPPTLDRRMCFQTWPAAHQSKLAELYVKQLRRIQNEVPRAAVKLLKHMPSADPRYLIELVDDEEAVDNKREIGLRLLGHVDGPVSLSRLTGDLKDAKTARAAIYALVPRLKYLPIADVATILDSTNCSHLQVAKQVLRLRADLRIPGWESLLIDKLRDKRAHDDIQRAIVRCLGCYLNLPQVWEALEEIHLLVNWRVLLEILKLKLTNVGDAAAERHMAMLIPCFVHEEPLLRAALYTDLRSSNRILSQAEAAPIWKGVLEALRRADDEVEVAAICSILHKFKSIWKQEEIESIVNEFLALYVEKPCENSLRRLRILVLRMQIGQDSHDLLRAIYNVPSLRLIVWRRVVKHNDWESARDFLDANLTHGLAEFYIMDAHQNPDGYSKLEDCELESFKHQDEVSILTGNSGSDHKRLIEGTIRGFLEIDRLRGWYRHDETKQYLPESHIPWPFQISDDAMGDDSHEDDDDDDQEMD